MYSVGPIALQPMGSPIIHSTNSGLRVLRVLIPRALDNPGACAFVPLGPLISRAVGVGYRRRSGEDEQPIAFVRGSEGCRGNAVPFDTPPERGHVSKNSSERPRKVAWYVLQEHESWIHLANDPPYFRPDPSLVVFAESFAGFGFRLAWIPRCNEIHSPAPASAVEGRNVVPDRSTIHARGFHPRHEYGCAVGLSFDNAHKTVVGSGESDSEVKPTNACAESEGT
jgi:hypothetical protein